MSANPNNQHLRLPPILDQQDGYVRRVPYTPEEMEVIEAGYRWPSINNFAPGAPLGRHRHQRENTHLIVEGSIVLIDDQDNREIHGPGAWVSVDGRASYRGIVGPNGCSFVEGHRNLSPQSLPRYVERERERMLAYDTAYRGAILAGADGREAGEQAEAAWRTWMFARMGGATDQVAAIQAGMVAAAAVRRHSS